jgi:spore coat polysaccharide biosynthesis protein SpsF
MKVIGIVLARLGSTRLPLKALAEVNGRPLISYAVERARQVPTLSGLVIATSTQPIDDALADFGRRTGVTVFRGSEDNVADRCTSCARSSGADYFVRINGDSPFADPALIEEGISMIADKPTPDLVTNLIGRSFPYGISVEVVSVATMERILGTLDKNEAEHVTKRFYDRPEDFRIQRMNSSFPELSTARLVVDTPEDLLRCRVIAEALGPRVTQARYQEIADLYLSIAKPLKTGNETALHPGRT